MSKRQIEISTNPKSAKMRVDELSTEKDKYDELGRNLTEQKRRQNAVRWTRVKYYRGRLLDPGPI